MKAVKDLMSFSSFMLNGLMLGFVLGLGIGIGAIAVHEYKKNVNTECEDET